MNMVDLQKIALEAGRLNLLITEWQEARKAASESTDKDAWNRLAEAESALAAV